MLPAASRESPSDRLSQNTQSVRAGYKTQGQYRNAHTLHPLRRGFPAREMQQYLRSQFATKNASVVNPFRKRVVINFTRNHTLQNDVERPRYGALGVHWRPRGYMHPFKQLNPESAPEVKQRNHTAQKTPAFCTEHRRSLMYMGAGRSTFKFPTNTFNTLKCCSVLSAAPKRNRNLSTLSREGKERVATHRSDGGVRRAATAEVELGLINACWAVMISSNFERCSVAT
jgi:hypothetical protein